MKNSNQLFKPLILSIVTLLGFTIYFLNSENYKHSAENTVLNSVKHTENTLNTEDIEYLSTPPDNSDEKHASYTEHNLETHGSKLFKMSDEDNYNIEESEIDLIPQKQQEEILSAAISAEHTIEGVNKNIALLHSTIYNPLRIEIIKNLWTQALDLDSADIVINALTPLTFDENIEIANTSSKAIREIQNITSGSSDYDTNLGFPSSVVDENIKTNQLDSDLDDFSINSIVEGSLPDENETLLAANTYSELYEKAINHPNSTERSKTISQLSGFHNSNSIEILISAADDENDDNRYLTAEALWKLAADGLDTDNRIQQTLEKLKFDNNKNVAQLAKLALTDLESISNIHNKTSNEINLTESTQSYENDMPGN